VRRIRAAPGQRAAEAASSVVDIRYTEESPHDYASSAGLWDGTPAAHNERTMARPQPTWTIGPRIGPGELARVSPDRLLKSSQGSRSAAPRPLSTSNGTEAWSCTICEAPSSFRKQTVTRTQMPLVAVPFISVPWSQPKHYPNATSPPTATLRPRTS
jgi:hypothetical protein